jgi:flagellar hook protein FlgE
MGLYDLLTTSASGMSAQSALLSTVSDNIANVDTTGYKEATTQFSSLVLGQGNVSGYQSGSVLVDPQVEIDGQGAINSTSSVTDLAVQGNGYFVVEGPNNQPVLTRVGSFEKDSSGNLVNAAGYTLLGYPVNGTGVANGFAGLVPVNLNNIALQATPTTSGTLYLNLPSTATVVTNPPSTYTTGATTPGYTDKTSLVAYDDLGNQVTFDVYTTNLGNKKWEVDVYNAADATNGGFPYTNNGGAPLTSATLTFSSTGQLSSTSPSPITVAVPNGQPMTLDMSQTTQLATGYTVLNAKTNGNAPSQVANVTIGSDGTLSAVYQNGSVVPAYTIPLANVTSPDNMTVITGNAYEPGLKSGAAQIGVAGTAGLGSIQSSALEASTVDLASELTTMIAAQNNYQANSKVFTTGSQLLQVLINLGH